MSQERITVALVLLPIQIYAGGRAMISTINNFSH
jgi:hypothetical protein